MLSVRCIPGGKKPTDELTVRETNESVTQRQIPALLLHRIRDAFYGQEELVGGKRETELSHRSV